VQVVVPSGGVEEAARFYADVVGLLQIERPETMGGVGAWFRAGSQELHVSEYEDFAPARKAHPAFELGAGDLDALAGTARSCGREGAVGRTPPWRPPVLLVRPGRQPARVSGEALRLRLPFAPFVTRKRVLIRQQGPL